MRAFFLKGIFDRPIIRANCSESYIAHIKPLIDQCSEVKRTSNTFYHCINTARLGNNTEQQAIDNILKNGFSIFKGSGRIGHADGFHTISINGIYDQNDLQKLRTVIKPEGIVHPTIAFDALPEFPVSKIQPALGGPFGVWAEADYGEGPIKGDWVLYYYYCNFGNKIIYKVINPDLYNSLLELAHKEIHLGIECIEQLSSSLKVSQETTVSHKITEMLLSLTSNIPESERRNAIEYLTRDINNIMTDTKKIYSKISSEQENLNLENTVLDIKEFSQITLEEPYTTSSLSMV